MFEAPANFYKSYTDLHLRKHYQKLSYFFQAVRFSGLEFLDLFFQIHDFFTQIWELFHALLDIEWYRWRFFDDRYLIVLFTRLMTN